jgi:hypothetical protein
MDGYGILQYGFRTAKFRMVRVLPNVMWVYRILSEGCHFHGKICSVICFACYNLLEDLKVPVTKLKDLCLNLSCYHTSGQFRAVQTFTYFLHKLKYLRKNCTDIGCMTRQYMLKQLFRKIIKSLSIRKLCFVLCFNIYQSIE